MIFDRGGEGQKRPYRVLKEILLERKLFLGANTKSKEKKKFAWIQSQFLFYLIILCNNPTIWNKILKEKFCPPLPPPLNHPTLDDRTNEIIFTNFICLPNLFYSN